MTMSATEVITGISNSSGLILRFFKITSSKLAITNMKSTVKTAAPATKITNLQINPVSKS